MSRTPYFPPCFIISGSSRGIGAAIAEELAKKGWNVVLNYVRNGQKAEELKDKLSKYLNDIDYFRNNDYDPAG